MKFYFAKLAQIKGAVMYRRFYVWGGKIAGRAADLSGNPLSILLVALFCAVWFLSTGSAGENLLTLILSVASITLTQMVLNGQRRSERALHLKMDELVIALEGARNEIAGVEKRTDEELDALRRDVEQPGPASGTSDSISPG